MATVDQGRCQRGDEERPQAVLLKEAEFRPQFLLRDVVRADQLSDLQGVKRALSLAPAPRRTSYG